MEIDKREEITTKQKTINNIRTSLFKKIDEEMKTLNESSRFLMNSNQTQEIFNTNKKCDKEFAYIESSPKKHQDKIIQKEDQKTKHTSSKHISNLNQEYSIIDYYSSTDESFSESEQDENFIVIYLHYLMSQENNFIEINNSNELENITEKIIKLLGAENKKAVCDNIKFLHHYCNLFKKRSIKKTKIEKQPVENNKKIHKTAFKKISTKNKLRKIESELYVSPKKEKKLKSKKSNSILINKNPNNFKFQKSDNIKKLLYNLKTKKKLKKNKSNAILDSNITNKLRDHQKHSDEQSLYSKCHKNKFDSPSNIKDSGKSKQHSSTKRKKNKKQTVQYFLSKKQEKNFCPEENEFMKSKSRSSMGFMELKKENKKVKSKNKEKKELKNSKNKNNKARGSVLINYKRLFDRESICSTRKAGKNNIPKKQREKNNKIHGINSSKTAKENKFEQNSFSNNTEIIEYKKKFGSNMSILSENNDIKTENLSHVRKRNNYQINKNIESKVNGFNKSDNSYSPECYNTYNEEGMDELLFTKKAKRRKKRKILNYVVCANI